MLLSYASSTHTPNFRSFGNSHFRSDFYFFVSPPPKIPLNNKNEQNKEEEKNFKPYSP